MTSKCRDVVFLGLGFDETDLPEAYVYWVDYQCSLGLDPTLIIDDIRKDMDWVGIVQGLQASGRTVPAEMLLRLKRLFKAGQITVAQVHEEVISYHNQAKQNLSQSSTGKVDPN